MSLSGQKFIPSKVYWIGAFILGLGLTAFLTVHTINEYANNPILYTFYDDEPTYKVPFPATTITGTAVFRKDVIAESASLIHKNRQSKSESFQFEGKTWTGHLVDILVFTIDHLCELVKSFSTRKGFLNPLKKVNLRDDPFWAEVKKSAMIDNVDDDGFQQHIVPFLKDKTLDCKNIMIACLWEGEEKECSELFVPIQTDVGSGCSFNRIPETLLRKRQGLMSLFHRHKYPDKEFKAWKKFVKRRRDSVITVDGVQDFIDLVHPRAQRHAGKLRGLSIMVKFDKDVEGMSCPIVDSNGYLLGIHSPFEEPQMMRTGVTIPPMHEVFVNVKADVTIADKGIKNLGISRRKCYFQDENPLQNFKVYTQGNCHQECLGSTIQKNCSCNLLTLSAGKNETLCGPVQQSCVQNATDNFEKETYDTLCVDPVCYPPCDDVRYSADASYLPYYKNDYFDIEKLNKEDVTSIIHVAFDSDSVSTRQRKLNFGFSILVGVLGGIWGMTFEFSLFTLFDILAGICVLIFSYWICPSLDIEEVGENVHYDEESPEEAACTNDVHNAGSSGLPPCVLTFEDEQENPHSDQVLSASEEDNRNGEDLSTQADGKIIEQEFSCDGTALYTGEEFTKIGPDTRSNDGSELEADGEYDDQSDQLAPETPKPLTVNDSFRSNTLQSALNDSSETFLEGESPAADVLESSLPDSNESLVRGEASSISPTVNDENEENDCTDTEVSHGPTEAPVPNLENPEGLNEPASALQGPFDLVTVVEELLQLHKLSKE